MRIRKELADKAIKQILACPAFAGAKEEALRYILASADVLLREVSKGQQIYPCHGVKKCVGLVLTGGCHRLKNGRIVAAENDGFVFGVQSLYSSKDDDFVLTASQDSKVIIIKKAAVDWLIQDDFSVARSYLGFLSDFANQVYEKPEGKNRECAEKKLAAYLLSRPKNAKNELELPQDMLKIAKQLNVTKDALFKAIEKLNSAGAIAFNGRTVCIADEEKLKKFTEDNID
ncbi:MAG: Crp/Fnr family transcriptional regulator [Clostridia bacterium]|nr:Crp/Fnr family transcriptional regulator [Clostridia bacterium]